jgi:hypothetical protein
MTTVRSLPATRATALLLAPVLSFAFGASLSAHRHDELLQAARISVEPDRVYVELNVTPGIAIADRVIRELDADGDGTLSLPEQHRYAEHLLERVALRVDDSLTLRPSLAGSSFPDLATIRSGEAPIAIRMEFPLPLLDVGAHRLAYRNNNTTDDSVYLANALVPESDRVAITAQQRDFDQRELIVDFTVREPRLPGPGWVLIGLASALASALLARPSDLVARR